jgi:hypothetical protein
MATAFINLGWQEAKSSITTAAASGNDAALLVRAHHKNLRLLPGGLHLDIATNG